MIAPSTSSVAVTENSTIAPAEFGADSVIVDGTVITGEVTSKSSTSITVTVTVPISELRSTLAR